MAIDIFPQCLTFVLNEEGGYVDNPADPGGATNHGITQSTYNMWRQSCKLPIQSVKSISIQEISDIYQSYYWTPSRANLFEYGLALVLFDTEVQFAIGTIQQFLITATNSHTPIQFLQQQPVQNQKNYALNIIQQRINFRHLIVQQDPSQEIFLQGWINRDNRLKQEVLNHG